MASYGALAGTGDVEGADETVGAGEEVGSVGGEDGGVWVYVGFCGRGDERVGCEEGGVEG